VIAHTIQEESESECWKAGARNEYQIGIFDLRADRSIEPQLKVKSNNLCQIATVVSR